MNANDKIEKLKNITCPHCGHQGPPKLASYVTSPNRAVCSECGKTVRTFITPVDFLMAAVAILILAAYFLAAP